MTGYSAKAGLALAGLCLPLLAPAAERLNVKLGLWEITSITEANATIPKELADTLTPQQRAEIAAQMKARAAKGPRKDVHHECLTQEDLDEPFRPGNDDDDGQCKTSVVSSTRTSQEMRTVCNGKPKAVIAVKMNVPTPESMNGTVDSTLGEGPDASTVKGKLSGRWLSADCGEEADDPADHDDDAEDEPDDGEEEEE